MLFSEFPEHRLGVVFLRPVPKVSPKFRGLTRIQRPRDMILLARSRDMSSGPQSGPVYSRIPHPVRNPRHVCAAIRLPRASHRFGGRTHPHASISICGPWSVSWAVIWLFHSTWSFHQACQLSLFPHCTTYLHNAAWNAGAAARANTRLVAKNKSISPACAAGSVAQHN